MRFNCGERLGFWERRWRRLQDWHDKFAWLPIEVGTGDCRWLEFVKRKGRVSYWHDGPYWEWEYRPQEIYYC